MSKSALALASKRQPSMIKIHAPVVVILFYLGWFGSVLLAKSHYAYVSLVFPLVLILFLGFTGYLATRSILLALGISALGVAFDAAVIFGGWITVSGAGFFPIPVWLLSIWLSFSFSMLKLGLLFNPPLWLAAILGLVMGPLSYKSGEAFGVLYFVHPSAFFIYGIFWAFIFPVVLVAVKRWV